MRSAIYHYEKEKQNMERGTLRFNPDTERWGVLSGGEWICDGLHCGDHLSALVGGQWVRTRIEMGEQGWYLVGTPYCGALDHVQVEI